MLIASSPSQLPDDGARAVTIGNFDGFHRGHQAVIGKLHEFGPAYRLTAITFWPHPRSVLGRGVRLLNSLERRLQLLGRAGMDEALVLPFSRRAAKVAAEDWGNSVLQPIRTEEVVVGEGFRFGAGRNGDIGLLRALGFSVNPVSLVPGASSSAARDLLAKGDVEAAEAVLGRAPELELDLVRVSHPPDDRTVAELTPSTDETLLPAPGVYVASIAGSPAVLTVPRIDGVEGGQSLTARFSERRLIRAPFQRVSLKRRLNGHIGVARG